MKKSTLEIKKLKIYLDLDSRNKVELTYLLGYRSTSFIDKWFERGFIPIRIKDKVLKIIERKI